MTGRPANPIRHQLASNSPIELRSLVRALRSASSPDGNDPVSRLAAAVRDEYDVAGVTLCGSGTEAVELALRAAEALLGKPGVVALPAFACFDVATAAVGFGRPVTFYDIDPSTLGPAPRSLDHALAQGANIVLTASLFGLPIDWDLFDPILERHGAVLVEDAAQGHGAYWDERPLGGHARLGVLSFGRGKGWTGGAGGALLVKCARDVPMVEEMALAEADGGGIGLAARVLAHWMLGRPGVYGIPRAVPGLGLGETRYREPRTPRAMPRGAAALATATREAAQIEAGRRRVAAAEYTERLEYHPHARTPTVPARGRGGYIRFPVLLPGGLAAFSEPPLALRLGAARSYPVLLPQLPQAQPLLGDLAQWPGSFPGAASVLEDIVTLPTHGMTRADERELLVRLLTGR